MREGKVEIEGIGSTSSNNQKIIRILVVLNVITVVIGIFLFGETGTKYALLATAIVIIATTIVTSIHIIYDKNNEKINIIYLCILIFLGLIFCFTFTPNTVPDEHYHYMSAYKYSDFLLGEEATDSEIVMRNSDYEYYQAMMPSHGVNRGQYGYLIATFSFFNNEDGQSVIPVSDTYSIATNVPQMRLPAALAITVARLLNLGPSVLFYLGRLANFSLFVVLAFLSVRITPIGKNAFRIISLLPMTLHVVSSYSYDSAVIGFSMVFSAVLLRALLTVGPISRREVIDLAITAVLLAPCKAIYSILLLGVLLIPSSRFSNKASSIKIKLIILTLSLCDTFLLRVPSLLAMSGMAQAASSVKKDGVIDAHYYSLGDLLSAPISTLGLLVRTFRVQGDFYLNTLVGGSLGNFQANIASPGFFVSLLYLVLGSTSVCDSGDSIVLSKSQRAFLLTISALTVVAIVFTFAMAWTFTYETVIQGVQGRYFVPLLPLLLVSIKGKLVQINGNTGFWSLLAIVYLDLLCLLGIISIVASS